MKLSDLRYGDSPSYKDITAVLPWGTVEVHGPHLSDETDTWIPLAVCEEAERLHPDKILLLPAMSYGHSPELIHMKYDTMKVLVNDLAESLYKMGVRELVLAGAHGGNNTYATVGDKTVEDSEGIIRDLKKMKKPNPMNIRYVDVLSFKPTSDGGYHANENETSMMIYIAELYGLPELVDISKACKNEHGVGGDATIATIENGKKYFEEMVDNLVKAIIS